MSDLYSRKLAGKLPVLGTPSTKAPDLFDRLGTALQQSNSRSKFELTKLSPELESKFIKEFTSSPWFRDFIKKTGGHIPDISSTSDYDYRGAWLDDTLYPVGSVDAKGEKKSHKILDLDATGPKAHGYSKDFANRKWLKNPQTHDTSWMQWYSEIMRKNPEKTNLTREKAAQIIEGKMKGHYVHDPGEVY